MKSKPRCLKANGVARDLEPSVLAEEIASRRALRGTGSDSGRLVDRGRFGEWALDDFADRWLILTWDAAIPEALITVARAAGARSLYRKRMGQKDAPVWVDGDRVERPFAIAEGGLTFEVDFAAGYSQGIFLDQRLNRAEVRRRARDGMTILNTFAYTCAFGVAAAAGGAGTTNIDLSRPYLDWGKRNYAASGLSPEAHEFLKGDTFDWMRRLEKKGRLFDGIILDPPTFSRDGHGRIFTVETRYGELVGAASRLLSAGGWILCTCNQESLSPAEFERIVTARRHGTAPWRATARPMPPEFTGPGYLKTLWIERA